MQLADLGARSSRSRPSRRLVPRAARLLRLESRQALLAVNLKTEEGRQIVEKLAERADVVMENMRPGVAERLGVGYERLSAINPRLIYSSVTAFARAPGLRSPRLRSDLPGAGAS